MEKHCIVHYPGYDTYFQLHVITPNNEIRLREAKECRTQLLGENYHKEQCDTIPNVIDQEKHCIDSAPCYKKFTLIISDKRAIKKTTEASDDNRRTSNRITLPSPSQIIYPEECYFYKKKIKRYGGKIEKKQIMITTLMAVNTIKKAAE